MKTTLILALLVTTQAWAAVPAKSFNFTFKSIKTPIQKSATTKEDAFKLAAKECYQQLTGGTYPGEEKGLDIIDICANPKM
ncbi:MAG: hypothetical protein H7061_08045 [Bdellovibrionaceae bacterium]|nr:hypothetical protein [Bdellovibrio sp.]